MQFRQLSQYRRFVTASAFVLIFTAFVSSCEAQSTNKISANQVLRVIVSEFVGIDGYWFTSASGADALGNPKFGSDAHFYVRPKHINGMEFTGGIELVGVSD